MPFLSPASAKDIHWTSSFLQPSTDFWGKGRHSLLRLLSYIGTRCPHYPTLFFCQSYTSETYQLMPKMYLTDVILVVFCVKFDCSASSCFAAGKVHLVSQNVKLLFRTSTVGFIILIRHHWLLWARVWLRSKMEVLLGSRIKSSPVPDSCCSRLNQYVVLPREKLETLNATYASFFIFWIFEICYRWCHTTQHTTIWYVIIAMKLLLYAGPC